MRRASIQTICAMLAFIICGQAQSVAKSGVSTFKVSGAQFTYATMRNDNGVIAGIYDNGDGISHGYVRKADGTITTFDPIGSQLTAVFGMNNSGDTVGYYFTDRATTTYHAFLRTADGNIHTIDPPGATIAEANGINNDGTVVGYFGPGTHGFIRAKDESFTFFDVSGADETSPVDINNHGQIAGWTFSGNKTHGFLRTSDGTITSFDAQSGADTTPSYINDSGAITGFFKYGANADGFVRTSDGQIYDVAPSGAHVTFPGNINQSGSFVGAFYKRDWYHGGPSHAFLGKSHLRTKILKIPGCKHAAASWINDDGTIVGDCFSAGSVFIRTR